jgi:hypothetical protein
VEGRKRRAAVATPVQAVTAAGGPAGLVRATDTAGIGRPTWTTAPAGPGTARGAVGGGDKIGRTGKVAPGYRRPA